MTDYDWVFNGIRPQWIISQDDTNWPQMTLHCIAYADDTYPTPKAAIDVFREMGCLKITNKPTQSGGTDVEPSIDGSIIPIYDGDTSYLGALYRPQVTASPNNENGDIYFDLIFELAMVNRTIIPDTPNPPDITKPYNLITTGFSRKINTIGVEEQLLGTFTFFWDGKGHVYVASDWNADPTTDRINIDDELIVTNSEGASFSRSCNAGNHYMPGPDIEITSFLEQGDNEISFLIKDIYGSMIGCGFLFVIQTD